MNKAPLVLRVRTLKIPKMIPLYQKIGKGEFLLLIDDEIVMEEELLIEDLEGGVEKVLFELEESFI